MIRSIVSISVAALIASPIYADAIAQGILLPKKESQAVAFSPQIAKELHILNILPQGTSVKKGDAVASSNLKPLEELIEDTVRNVRACELNLQRLNFDLEQQKIDAEQQIKYAKQSLTRAEEDLSDFLDKRKTRMLAEEEERVAKALRVLSYKQEELNQLIKMYKDDQVAEETEEIILTRLKNELSESEFAVEGAKLMSDLTKLRNIKRMEEDLRNALDRSKQNLKKVEGTVNFDLEEKQLAVETAGVTLKRAQSSLSDLQGDREMAQFKAPVNGIFIHGGYIGDRWEASSMAVKLKPGGKLEPFDKLGTIVPLNSELIVQAVLPDSAPTPKEGEQVIVKITNTQIPGTVAKANSIPDADGKRRIIVKPQAPAEKIFFPGLPVQVTIKSDQA